MDPFLMMKDIQKAKDQYLIFGEAIIADERLQTAPL